MEYYDKTPIRPRAKPMKVLILGLSRTGTASLYAAQKDLGLKPYHFVEVMRNKENDHQQLWLKAIRAKYDGIGKPFKGQDFDQMLWNYDSVSDAPACLFVEELIAAYPEAKVILTIRTRESWMKSMQNTILKLLSWRSWTLLSYFDRDLSSHYWSLFNRATSVMSNDLPPWKTSSYPALLKYFDEHHDLVRRVVPEGRLLEYHASQGWGPLCDFLELPVPEAEFPRVNESEHYIEVHKDLYWTRWRVVAGKAAKSAGTVALVLGIAWWMGASFNIAGKA